MTTTTGYAPVQTAVAATAMTQTINTQHVPLATTTTVVQTTTTQYGPPVTTTTTATPITVTQAGPDYEAMGQAAYQDEAIRALNALRAQRGLPPMVPNPALMASCLAQAQKMTAAGRSFHTEGNPPGFESVSHVPCDFPAQVLGEMLTLHVSNFLMDGYDNVGIAVVRSGSTLYACMQGN